MILSTPHAHTSYVDGKNTPREMVEEAVRKGFASIGFSEHASQPFDPEYALQPELEEQYIRDVITLREEYRSKIAIHLGIERDRESFADRTKYEYVIGSVHYLSWGNGYASVDGDAEELRQCMEEQFGGSGIAMVAEYYDRLAGYICAYKPDIIGHFDLIRKLNCRVGIFDSNDPAYRKIVFNALDRMIDSGAYLEVNTGAIARGYLPDPYPEAFELEYWRKMGGKAIIGTDCHQAEKLDCGYDLALKRLREAGYTSVMAIPQDGPELFREYEI